MKTLVCVKPGELQYATADQPQPSRGMSIIKVKRVGICGTDLHAFDGTQPYFNYPRILGHELAGELVYVDGAQEFSSGDAVTFIPYISCGQCIACRRGITNACVRISVCGVHCDGGMAEYYTVPSSLLVHGDGLSLDTLALIEPLAIGAHAVSRAGITPGEHVLIIGAGPIGLGAMEIVRSVGGKVIMLDVNNERLRFCKEQLDVAYTINGNDDHVQEYLEAITNGEMPTVIMDATGNLNAINNAFRYMAHGARYILVGLQKGDISFNHPEFHKREATLMSSRNATRSDFEHVVALVKRKKFNPVKLITHRVRFEEVKDRFHEWLNPTSGAIKVMVEFG
ncbi:zinc-binding alcohol dehydrogenase family protein [Pseudochryseolinea flava]|uniref:Alcohol dehydrogenase n=1 Tax=Pseudochryseolinea flava TaxID=2059302 RepID=A0A364XWV2_9BACT|nr:zinc-binding alcohol dehydrogenase family protein [Pseudochryseolinea flava]RAV98898.1 alcohol dehydrogenase [Pseudochryseolinea flava]